MTTTTPLPPHGTTARAVGRPAAGIKGCTCRPCRTERNAYIKRRLYLAATDRSLTVDAAPAIAHLRMLLDAGSGWKETARAAGISAGSLSALVSGKQKRVRRTSMERILALQPKPAPKVSIPSLGTVRRVQALIAAGHRARDIAAAAGLDICSIVDVTAGKPSVRRETADAIAKAYRQLAGIAGNNTRGINRGRRMGWPTPAEWAGDIDDPNVDPSTWARDDDGRRAAVALAEDADFIMRTTGVGIELAAERLGVPRNTLEKARERTAARARAAARADQRQVA